MLKLMSDHRLKGRPIPWPTRQKWAKQIVRGIAAYHERGPVIAGMRTYSNIICIDHGNDAMILGFPSPSHPVVHGTGGLLLPEYRTEAFGEGDGKVGPDLTSSN